MHRRRLLVLPLALAALPALAGTAPADQAYDRVAEAYARAGGHLEPCAFTQPQLEAAVRGIPPNIRNVVPALRAAMVEGIAAHERGDCRGAEPDESTTGGARVGGAGSAPTTTTPPVTTPPATTETAPAATTPTTPTTVAPAPAATQPPATAPARERDRTPLVIALIAIGALVLLALLAWGWARMRGLDPAWAARTRHAWGEAGLRTTSTWSEFTDWLRLGR